MEIFPDEFEEGKKIMAAKFHYSGYWHSWSLVLSESCEETPGYGRIVEISLTGPDYESSQDTLRLLNVRRHEAMRRWSDKQVDILPLDDIQQVIKTFGAQVADFLLNSDPADILALIDFEKLHARKYGGASLYDVVKDGKEDHVPVPPSLARRPEPRP